MSKKYVACAACIEETFIRFFLLAMVALLFPPPFPSPFCSVCIQFIPAKKWEKRGGGGGSGGRAEPYFAFTPPSLSAVGLSALFCNYFPELVTEIWTDIFLFLVVFSKTNNKEWRVDDSSYDVTQVNPKPSGA